MVINKEDGDYYARLSIWCFVIVFLVASIVLARMAW